MLVSAILYRSLRLAGVLGAPGRTPSTIQLNEALDVANSMLDSWNTERLIIYEIERSIQTLVAGTQDYLIGTGQTFNVDRPSRIERAGLIYLSNPAQPLEVPMQILTVADWSSIPVKVIPSTIPTQLYYEPSFPYGTIHLWPIPSMVNQLALYLWKKISQFTSTGQTVTFPDGYLKAITYNIAVELSALMWEGHPIRVSPKVEQIAVESKAKIKALNIGIMDIGVDQALVQRFDGQWNNYTGDWQRGPF